MSDVDPDKDRCPECNCSFGVHLKTCSQFDKKCLRHGTFKPCSMCAHLAEVR